MTIGKINYLFLMKTLPKPKHCEQNWLAMTPTEGGRICGQCSKRIVDFSNMTWAEIELLQRQNGNGLCGMYTPKQLDYWGQEIPSNRTALVKATTIAGLAIALASNSQAQTVSNPDSLVLKGKVIDDKTSEAIPFASIQLKNCRLATKTDLNGNFQLVLKNIPTTSMRDTLEVRSVGYSKRQIIFENISELNNADKNSFLKDGIFLLSLNLPIDYSTVFYVRKPSLTNRIKWRVKNWFNRIDR